MAGLGSCCSVVGKEALHDGLQDLGIDRLQKYKTDQHILSFEPPRKPIRKIFTGYVLFKSNAAQEKTAS